MGALGCSGGDEGGGFGEVEVGLEGLWGVRAVVGGKPGAGEDLGVELDQGYLVAWCHESEDDQSLVSIYREAREARISPDSIHWWAIIGAFRIPASINFDSATAIS